jgi:nucleotide-binding universal stress UspA family protein
MPAPNYRAVEIQDPPRGAASSRVPLLARSSFRDGVKDILLLADSTSSAANHYAVSVASEFGAHLTVAPLAIDPATILAFFEPLSALVATAREEKNRREAEGIANDVAAQARAVGVAAQAQPISAEVGAIGEALGRSIRRFDLTVIEQPNPAIPTDRRNLIDAALFNSGRPLLIVPYVQEVTRMETILIAWDNSLSAARSLANAMPWLKRARKVEVVTVDNQFNEGLAVFLPGVKEHLAFHGVEAECRPLSSAGGVAKTLLSHSLAMRADLLVMGGYGHFRFHEFVLGGVTRRIIHSMNLPVLMTH